MNRKKPLRRSWFKSRGPSWRSEPEYRAAVEQAFKEYTRGDSIKCIFCGAYFQFDDITPCHIRSVGANFELRAEPLNLVPACFVCHGRYEKKTGEQKYRAIEKVLKGRWQKLDEIKRERQKVYAEVKE